MDRPAKAGTPKFDHITMFSDEEILEINKELGVVEHERLGWRPSAGFWAILFFIRKCNYKSLTLIGFDFFSKSLPFKTGDPEFPPVISLLVKKLTGMCPSLSE